jgi:hypothetical protein
LGSSAPGQLEIKEQRGFTMEEGLKTILRIDADIVLVGEMRDSVSAKIGARAALAGRLVLGTIHARDITMAIESMRYLSVPDHVLGYALRMVIAQDLVRKPGQTVNRLGDGEGPDVGQAAGLNPVACPGLGIREPGERRRLRATFTPKALTTTPCGVVFLCFRRRHLIAGKMGMGRNRLSWHRSFKPPMNPSPSFRRIVW